MALNGSLAGSIAGFTATPFDVLKTRLMTQNVKEKQLKMMPLAMQILKEDGI